MLLQVTTTIVIVTCGFRDEDAEETVVDEVVFAMEEDVITEEELGAMSTSSAIIAVRWTHRT